MSRSSWKGFYIDPGEGFYDLAIEAKDGEVLFEIYDVTDITDGDMTKLYNGTIPDGESYSHKFEISSNSHPKFLSIRPNKYEETTLVKVSFSGEAGIVANDIYEGIDGYWKCFDGEDKENIAPGETIEFFYIANSESLLSALLQSQQSSIIKRGIQNKGSFSIEITPYEENSSEGTSQFPIIKKISKPFH